MKSLILIFCFLPLVVIYIIMKLSVWIASIESETEYVREDSKRSHGPYLADAYADVDKEEEEFGD